MWLKQSTTELMLVANQVHVHSVMLRSSIQNGKDRLCASTAHRLHAWSPTPVCWNPFCGRPEISQAPEASWTCWKFVMEAFSPTEQCVHAHALDVSTSFVASRLALEKTVNHLKNNTAEHAIRLKDWRISRWEFSWTSRSDSLLFEYLLTALLLTVNVPVL